MKNKLILLSMLMLVCFRLKAQVERINIPLFQKTFEQAIDMNAGFQKNFRCHINSNDVTFEPGNTYDVIPSDKLVDFVDALSVGTNSIKGLRIQYGLTVVDKKPRIINIYSPVELVKDGLSGTKRNYNVKPGYKYYKFDSGNFVEIPAEAKDVYASSYTSSIRKKNTAGQFQSITLVDMSDNNDAIANTLPWDAILSVLETEAMKLYDSVKNRDINHYFIPMSEKENIVFDRIFNSSDTGFRFNKREIESFFDVYMYSGTETLTTPYSCCPYKHTVVCFPYRNDPGDAMPQSPSLGANLGSLCPSHCGVVSYEVIDVPE